MIGQYYDVSMATRTLPSFKNSGILSQCALRIAELESQHWPHVQIRLNVAWHGAYLPPIDIE